MCMNLNRSDIIHYYHHAGLPSRVPHYYNPRDPVDVSRERLGPDILSGQKFQVLIPGDYWRCAHMLMGSELGASSDGCSLTSEAVAPGFAMIMPIIN